MAVLTGELQQLRRTLHRVPEVGLHLPQTQTVLLAELSGLPVSVTCGQSLSSVVAVLHGAHPGPTVLLRSDMDALPIRESTGLPFASQNGAMHACGHDLHMAALIGAARRLAAHRERLHGSVVFMFQPGEEGPGGAERMLDEGVLEASGQLPVAAYGLHVWTDLPRGRFLLREGAIMAGSNSLLVDIVGRGGHSAAPWNALDPVGPLCEIVTRVRAAVAAAEADDDATRAGRRISQGVRLGSGELEPIVLSPTQLCGSSVRNVIPDTAGFGASLRTLSAESAGVVEQLTRQIVDDVTTPAELSSRVKVTSHYPATVNDSAETANVAHWLGEAFGRDRVSTLDEPLMSSEDFSYVLQRVPGVFFMLGAAAADVPEPASNHSARAVFDDSVIDDAARALATLAWRRVHQ
ncbi:M20 metallopeptidase family protein [Pseudoclavibacter sp. CFCC 13611]|uniref:M20 metallopeptidase family protein n=1 Tax=Pseudoclavibacter sp. CFCC 13611 TaxID=2615178 RepID=UPI001300DE93|nr:amidohydrolase [Pseudoclavibacter sp. CFCC 13611]